MSRLNVVVKPKSPRNEVQGLIDGELLIRVSVPPEGGKANKMVCQLVAKALRCPKSLVKVVRGETSRHKQLEVPIEENELAARLSTL